MKKIFIYIIFIFLLFTANVNAGFLDGDLGLNLYKNIEKGLIDFEEKQYLYELKGQKSGELAENLNKILKSKKIGDCLNEDLNNSDVEKLALGNYSPLKDKLKEECYDKEKKQISQKIIQSISSEINRIKIHYKTVAKDKAKHIEEISRIGMYADGVEENSPFDLIVDIQDIDKIIFKQETKYNSDNGNDYSDSEYEDTTNYLDNPDEVGNDPESNNGGNNGNNNSNSGSNNNGITPGTIPSNSGSQNNNGNNTNNYLCVNNNNLGLNNNSINKLLGKKTKQTKTRKGHKKLPGTNKLPNSKIPNLSDPDFLTKLCAGKLGKYEKVNDNDFWECNQFFCITINFIIKDFNPLSYDYSLASRSIENILETTAKHLKKAANTSLAQHKMTTNNFEMSLRFPYLPDMFHLGVVIVGESSPILDIEKKDENNIEKNKEYVQNLLKQEYTNLGLDYNNKNSLKNFTYVEQKLKGISKSYANSMLRPGKLENEYEKIEIVQSKVNDYSSTTLSKKLNNKLLSDFEKQFSELEKFTYELLDLVNNSQILIKEMNKIPTYSG